MATYDTLSVMAPLVAAIHVFCVVMARRRLPTKQSSIFTSGSPRRGADRRGGGRCPGGGSGPGDTARLDDDSGVEEQAEPAAVVVPGVVGDELADPGEEQAGRARHATTARTAASRARSRNVRGS